MGHVSFFIPIKPESKLRARFARGGRVYSVKKTSKYESAVKSVCRQTMERKHLKPFESCVCVVLRFNFEHPQSWSERRKKQRAWHTSKPDLDNLVKAVLDALNGVAYTDDKLVVRVDARKIWSTSDSVSVTVEELSESEAIDYKPALD